MSPHPGPARDRHFRRWRQCAKLLAWNRADHHFAVELHVLPATGMGPDGSDSFDVTRWAQVKYAILPVITTAMVPLGIVMRSTRAAVAEILSQDFIQTLHAKGLSRVAVLRHAVRNALPQMLAVMGLQFGYLVAARSWSRRSSLGQHRLPDEQSDPHA